MLTRLYVDNFRCLVNFEYRPGRRQLILGRNGSGKSSFLDALLVARNFAVQGDQSDNFFLWRDRTRWLNQGTQTWELEAQLDGKRYLYRLVVEPWGEPSRPRVKSETVQCDDKPIFEFINGEVHLFNDRFELKVKYPFDWHRSALATITPRKENQTLSRFQNWLGGLVFFRINPFAMDFRAEKEDVGPNVNLGNFAAWYRHLVQASLSDSLILQRSLHEVLENFNELSLDRAGDGRMLMAKFARPEAGDVKFAFHELSEGQRCLIGLYAILHFVLVKGNTVIIDEPENFVSLRELQPWLMAVSDAVDEGKGQIIVISHHPEFINQWAPDYGVQFVRDGTGPVRVEEFRGGKESNLTPAELVARGWDRE